MNAYSCNLGLDELRDFLICELVGLVGMRDTSWILKPTTQLGSDCPQIMYPDLGNKHVSINLTDSTKKCYQQRLFQLSHEVVHLLNPNGSMSASYFEEGFATYNSVEICKKYAPTYNAISGISHKYKDAYNVLVKIHNPYEVVKAMRFKGYTLSQFNKNVLLKLSNNKLTKEDVDFLARNFYSFAAANAVNAGNSAPSKNSKKAPPPVDK